MTMRESGSISSETDLTTVDEQDKKRDNTGGVGELFSAGLDFLLELLGFTASLSDALRNVAHGLARMMQG
jgi:hypothetical protein